MRLSRMRMILEQATQEARPKPSGQPYHKPSGQPIKSPLGSLYQGSLGSLKQAPQGQPITPSGQPKVMPDYRERKMWLKKHGAGLDL